MLPLSGKAALIIRAAVLFLLFCTNVAGQQLPSVSGRVSDLQGNPVENAVLMFQPGGIPVFTDSVGFFRTERPLKAEILVISAPGFLRDTLRETSPFLDIILRPGHSSGNDILVTGERNPGQTDFRSAGLKITIDRQEMRKAACCNLSESFETSPLVDVSFPDPVSGIRQIQMLGLSSQYTGFSIENQVDEPGVLGPLHGGLIPGPWLESIQVQKVIGSAVAGSGMLGGQINAGFLRADTGSPLIANAYLSDMGRAEANLILPLRRSISGGTQLFLHGSSSLLNMDMNSDRYRDFPLGLQWNGMIRTRHEGKRGTFLQVSGRAYRDERRGGDVAFTGTDPASFAGFGFLSHVTGAEFSGKAGKVFPAQAYRSLGIPWSAGHRRNHQKAGKNVLMMEESWLRADPVFQTDIGKRGNGLKAGASLQIRHRQDHFRQMQYATGAFHFSIREQRAGAFAEATMVLAPGFLAIAGSRLDVHNLYGLWHSPRIHFRYEHSSGLVLRLGAGQAWQEPWIFAQNASFFFSGRKLEINTTAKELPYGLKAERGRSVNFSANLNYRLLPGKGSILLDLYAAGIQHQVVADAETTGILRIYNSPGMGETQGAGLQVDQKFGRKLNVRLAWRYSASWMDYADQRRMRPLHSFHRGLAAIDFFPGRNFQLNSSLQIHGRKRLYGTANFSRPFPVWNMQISKVREGRHEIAVGVENLLNFMQQDLVQFPEVPLSPDFDAARIWGPSIGRMFYLNFRVMY